MKDNRLILVLLLVLLLCFPAAMAQTMSFSDPDSTVHRDVYLYAANGTLIGLYNTTSSAVTVPTGDFLITLKPQYTNPLDDPATFLTNIVGWLSTNALVLLVLAAMAGLLFKRF